MYSDTASKGKNYKNEFYTGNNRVAGLMIAHSISPIATGNRYVLESVFTVGRKDICTFSIPVDQILSGKHFSIIKNDEDWYINDLGSKNGTFVNGVKIHRAVKLDDQAVICAGNNIFVFLRDARRAMNPPAEQYGMCGLFHVEEILNDLQDAAASTAKRHVLLIGPSGSGKEFAAAALAVFMSPTETPLPLCTYNVAQLDEELAVPTLIGVAKRTFSNVDETNGLINDAGHGALFLDEIHGLPVNAQRSLLRWMETGKLSRLGEGGRSIAPQTRAIMASNADDPCGGVIHDLFSRSYVVKIPPIRKRVADIPCIFNHFLQKSMTQAKVSVEVCDLTFDALYIEYYEAMCIDRFLHSNVRGIIDLCDRISLKVAKGVAPHSALNELFNAYFSKNKVFQRRPDIVRPSATKPKPIETCATTMDKGQKYQENKNIIIATFLGAGNQRFSTTKNILEMRFSLDTSRSALKSNLQRWGIV